MDKINFGASPPLVIDMDGTLFYNDTMHEALVALLATRPLEFVGLFTALPFGKPFWKAALASKMTVDAADMRVRPEVIAEINAAKDEGRRVALVSASDHSQVVRVADTLGLFDEAYGTSKDIAGGKNLSGQAKADFLAKHFGPKGFDYIGDSTTDAPVWAVARQAIVAGGDKAALRIASAHPYQRVLRGKAAKPTALLTAMRPHQWMKNLLVFIPILASQQFGEFLQAILAFIAFCFVASGAYLINDMMDLKADRSHPRKRNRPFASSEVSLLHGALLAAALFGAGTLISLTMAPVGLFLILMTYLALTLAYSLKLKRSVIIDIWILAGLYTIRIVAGGLATGVALSPWLLTFAMFLFLGLAAIKRQAELSDTESPDEDFVAGRAYVVSDLPVIRSIAIAAGYASVLVFALYINSLASAEVYSQPQFLWGVCPILLFWFSHMVMITHRGAMDDDPLLYAIRDKVSLLCGGAVASFFVLATSLP